MCTHFLYMKIKGYVSSISSNPIPFVSQNPLTNKYYLKNKGFLKPSWKKNHLYMDIVKMHPAPACFYGLL